MRCWSLISELCESSIHFTCLPAVVWALPCCRVEICGRVKMMLQVDSVGLQGNPSCGPGAPSASTSSVLESLCCSSLGLCPLFACNRVCSYRNYGVFIQKLIYFGHLHKASDCCTAVHCSRAVDLNWREAALWQLLLWHFGHWLVNLYDELP